MSVSTTAPTLLASVAAEAQTAIGKREVPLQSDKGGPEDVRFSSLLFALAGALTAAPPAVTAAGPMEEGASTGFTSSEGGEPTGEPTPDVGVRSHQPIAALALFAVGHPTIAIPAPAGGEGLAAMVGESEAFDGRASSPGASARTEGSQDTDQDTDLDAGLDAVGEALFAADAVLQEASILASPAVRGLNPDFLGRLRRVAERMAEEHGMSLEVVEGVRTRARQMELYAQGRTSPGPIVTWTTNSLHLSGEAADLRLDGAPPEGEAALLLARVAREEGLKTLYPFDSGHIQVEGVGDMEGPEARLDRPVGPSVPSIPPRSKGLAVPAPVARPAKPAEPGRPGALEARSPEPTDPATGSGTRAILEARAVPVGPEAVAVPDAPDATRRSSELHASRAETASHGQRPVDAVLPPAIVVSESRGRVLAGGPEPAGPVWRPAPVPDLPSTPADAVRSVLVPLGSGEDAGAVRVGIRSGLVHAEVHVADAGLGDRLARNVQELRRGLAERGLDAGELSVRWVAAPDPLSRAVADVGGRQGEPGLRDGSPGHSGQRTARDPADPRDRDGRDGRGPRREERG